MFIVCVVANAHMSLLNRKYEITSVTHTEDCGFDSQPASQKLPCDNVINLNLACKGNRRNRGKNDSYGSFNLQAQNGQN